MRNPQFAPGMKNVLDRGFDVVGDIKNLVPNAISDAKTVADLAQASADMANASTEKEYNTAVNKYMKTAVKAVGRTVGKAAALMLAPSSGFLSTAASPIAGEIGSQLFGGIFDAVMNSDVKDTKTDNLGEYSDQAAH